MKRYGFLLLVALLLLSACGGETYQDVAGAYQSQFAEMRGTLQAIAQSLPERAPEQKAPDGLEPTPRYAFYHRPDDSSEVYNTDILMSQHLLDPDLELGETDQIDLALSRYLVTYLRWTGPHNPMSGSTREARAPKELAAQLEKALQMEYLGVVRVVDYVPVVATDAESFEGGLARMDAFLVDVESREVLCSFRITVRVDEEVSYTYEEGEDQRISLAEAANERLQDNVREQLMKTFSDMCKGDFSMQ